MNVTQVENLFQLTYKYIHTYTISSIHEKTCKERNLHKKMHQYSIKFLSVNVIWRENARPNAYFGLSRAFAVVIISVSLDTLVCIFFLLQLYPSTY